MRRRRYSQTLDPQLIADTAAGLAERVHERFTGRRLDDHARKFAEHTALIVREGRRAVAAPISLRVASWLGGGGALLLVVSPFVWSSMTVPEPLHDFMETLDSSLTVIAATVAGFFTMRSISQAASRRRALQGLAALRAFAHVTDMLQVTKSPARLIFPMESTASSPEATDSPIEMGRYLSYCCELYTLTSKLALLYADWVPDATVLSTVDDIEDLCTDLEQKATMKMLLLDRYRTFAGGPSTPSATPPPNR